MNDKVNAVVSDLEDEIYGLRCTIDNMSRLMLEAARTIEQQAIENAKLRGLARYAIKCSAGEVDCQTCPFGEASTRGKVTSCKVETAARELGVDVDDLTPEQAIEATLELGTCKIECFDDGVDEGLDGEWYSYSPPTWYLSCGHTCEGLEGPDFCPICGRRVVNG